MSFQRSVGIVKGLKVHDFHSRLSKRVFIEISLNNQFQYVFTEKGRVISVLEEL